MPKKTSRSRNLKFSRPGLSLCLGIAFCGLVDVAPIIAQAPTETTAILELEINQAKKGEVVVILRGDDVLIPWEDLVNAGLGDVQGSREIIDGIEHVSLASLAPDITFARDDRDLVLRIQTQAELLPPGVINFNPTQVPAGIIYSQPLSAYLNYGFGYQDLITFSAFSELSISFSGNAFYSGFSLGSDGQFNRGLSNLVLDNRHTLTSLVIGDTAVQTDLLGGGGILGGISWGRNFGLSPYLVRQPGFNVQGIAETPSTAEVYVNGRLIRTLEIAPGPFQLQNLPFTSGFNTVRVIVRDANGQEQVFNSNYVQFSTLLQPGLSEFNYSLGVPRQNLNRESFTYNGDVQLLAFYRQGILSNLTAGGRLEVTDSLVSGGFTLSTALPIGTLDVAGALSSSQGVMGSAAAVAYSYPGNIVSFGGGVRLQSDYYTNTGLGLATDRSRVEGFFGASVPLGPFISLSGQYNLRDSRDAGQNDRMSLIAQMRINQNTNVFLQASRTQFATSDPINEISLNLNYFLGNNLSLNAGWQQSNNGGIPTIQLQRYLPPGEGYGYQVQVSQPSQQANVQTNLQYNTSWSRLGLGFNPTGDTLSTVLLAEGGIVAIGGEVYLTRPVQGSFALLQVPNVADVRGYLSNQEIGRTNAKGNLLIPDLLPYYGNQLSINDQDIDINFEVPQTEQLIAPPFRGGAIAKFNVRRVQNIVGTVFLEQGTEKIIPSLGQLVLFVNEKPVISPLTRTGQFYFENIPQGTYPAELRYEQFTCRFDLSIPESTELFIELATVICQL